MRVHPFFFWLRILLLIKNENVLPVHFEDCELKTGRKMITGIFIGSIKEMEEMLEFWKEKGLSSMIEVVKMDYINKAIERLEKNDVRYRFVVDVAGSK